MVEVVRAGPDDWQRVRALRLRALRDAPDAFWATADEEEGLSPAQWRERLAAGAMFVAVSDGRLVGLAVAGPHWREPADAGLSSLWVAPELRGSAAAAALVAAVAAWARGAGYRRLRLEVADDNHRAVRFYERLGFTSTGWRGTMPPPREHIAEHERVLEL